MESINETKDMIRLKLEEVKRELDKTIESQKGVVSILENGIDIMDMINAGNMIKHGNTCRHYYLIAGNAVIDGSDIVIPVRHHVYPIFSAGCCEINCSGVVDTLSIPVQKIGEIEVLTAHEFFMEHKERYTEECLRIIEEYVRRIDRCKDVIEEKIKEVSECHDRIMRYKEALPEEVYMKSVEDYLNSERFTAISENVDSSHVCWDKDRRIFL